MHGYLFILEPPPSLKSCLRHCLLTGPSWLKNLYFAYLIVLRAITKAEPFWKDFTFYTGDPIEEREIKENIMEIVQAAK